MTDTIDLHLGEAPENFQPDCTDPRWILTVTCGDQMNVTTFSKQLADTFPEMVQWLSDRAVHKVCQDVYAAALRAENEELKQWASDACELIHIYLGYDAGIHDERISALLRRMENP